METQSKMEEVQMSFLIAGDTHGTLDLAKVVQYYEGRDAEFSKDEDYLIILGDVGVCGFSALEEAATRAILRNLPVTTLFIDGNHENFEHLNSYPIDEWNGGKVHFIESDIIHLMRGQVFDIAGTTFFPLEEHIVLIECIELKDFPGFPRNYQTTKSMRKGGITWKDVDLRWITS